MKDTLIKLQDGFVNASKEDLITTAIETAKDLIEGGHVDPSSEFVKAKKMMFFLDQFCKQIQGQVDDETLQFSRGQKHIVHGAELIYKSASGRLNYSEDHVVAELEQKLSERKDLIKTATNTKEPIYDAEGVEVTKVSITYSGGGTSVTIK